MKLKIENLTKSYDEKIILNNIDIELNNLKSLAIIGPSGGGKSTLLRLLAGLEKPNSGKISIDDSHISFEENKLREYRKSIGMVFQSYNLFPHLSAIDNIVLPLTLVHGRTHDQAETQASKLLSRFQLEEHKHKKPHKLSGGQQQRIAIARALALDSKFLLLDEPTSALDPELTNEVLDMIKILQKENKDLILVTHEMGFARQACDYTIFISNGKILEHGHSKELFKNPKTKELSNFLNTVLEWQ